jgi:hypothetical protein
MINSATISFRRVHREKLQNAPISFIMLVCLHVMIQKLQNGFTQNLIFTSFTKICVSIFQFWLKLDRNNYIHFCVHLEHNFVNIYQSKGIENNEKQFHTSSMSFTVAMCLCAFQILHQLTEFHETRYELYASGGHLNILLNYL